MLKNNKGISLITLILTIIVILILTAIFVSSGLDSIFEAKGSKNANEIAQLKSAVADRFNSYLKNEDTVALVGKLAKNTESYNTVDECVNKIISTLDFEKATDEEKNAEKNRISNNISRDYEKYVMIIESGDMAQLGLENYSKTNRYIVDYYTGAVYGPISD